MVESKMTFAQEYLCEPMTWSDEDRRADTAAEEYEVRCEAFDRIVCSLRNKRGTAIPGNIEQLATICRNAKVVLADMVGKYGVSPSALRQGLRRLQRRDMVA